MGDLRHNTESLQAGAILGVVTILALLLLVVTFRPAMAFPSSDEEVVRGGQVTDNLFRNAVQISAGSMHTCALDRNGDVWCWGYNYTGQLGTGNNESTTVPVRVSGLPRPAVAIGLGDYHTCAVLEDGSVWCWGANYWGELGNGKNGWESNSNVPVKVLGLPARAHIVVGGYEHTCALLEDGSVWCWGGNQAGELGIGQIGGYRNTPTRVNGLSEEALNISAGYWYTCVVVKDGSVWCWGLRSPIFGGPTPVRVENLPRSAVMVATGGDYLEAHTCALLDDKTVWCWGSNGHGQLGSPAGGQVTGLPVRIQKILVGDVHTCALAEDGSVWCWGDNEVGQSGNSSDQFSVHPNRVTTLPQKVRDIAVGDYHTCALEIDGTVWCWGSTNNGRLGSGEDDTIPLPLPVWGVDGSATRLALGYAHSCVLLETGYVQCWGDNSYGQVGGEGQGIVPIPQKVSGLPAEIRSLATGDYHTCAIASNGSLWCWGRNWAGQLGNGESGVGITESHPVEVRGLPLRSINVTAGSSHTCAVVEYGTVWCWGGNYQGQLGIGTTSNSPTPVRVRSLPGAAINITAGEYHTCAMLNDGSVWCWGGNSNGQLGIGTTSNSPTPVRVRNLPRAAVGITAGQYHTCVVLNDGSVWCWGNNMAGQLGNGSTNSASSPVRIAHLPKKAVAIVAGGFHTCAILEDNTAWCWGAGIGNGGIHSTPMRVPGLGGHVEDISVGYSHACARVRSSNGYVVWCWGSNGHGELGIPSIVYKRARPVPVREEPIPHLISNYRSGRPGSWFTVWGLGFPRNARGTLAINGQVVLGNLKTSATGTFVVFVHSRSAPAGAYLIEAQVGDKVGRIIVWLDSTKPWRPLEGDGRRVGFPEDVIPLSIHMTYLPTLQW